MPARRIREMVAWFERRVKDAAPGESTTRRKVAMVWREMKRVGESV